MLARLPESDLFAMSAGVPAQVTPVGSSKTYQGSIWQISPVIDPASRQGVARIAVPYDRDLRPGGFATASITAGSVDAPLLPESAVLNDSQGTYVYIVDKDNAVRRRPVKVASVTDGGVVVGEGPQRPQLERAVCRNGLTGLVELAGALTHEELPSVYAESDVVVVACPLTDETRGLLLGAAVATTVGAVDDVRGLTWWQKLGGQVAAAAFQLTPQSLRLTVVVASKPALVLPHGSWPTPPNSTSKVTGLVTSLMVRSPVTSQSSPSRSTLVETKVISGNSSMARKSLLRRCSSRWALRVSMLAALIVTLALELAGLSPSR